MTDSTVRAILLLAKAAASRAGREAIDCEHVLAALLARGGGVFESLLGTKAGAFVVPESLTPFLLDPESPEDAPETPKLPFSKALQAVLGPGIRQVMVMIGTQQEEPVHLAAALLLADTPASESVRSANGLTLEEVREKLGASPTKDPPQPSRPTLGKHMGLLSQLRDRLRGDVFGQDHAIDALLQGCFASALLGASRRRPQPTSFLFIGDSGCGKTFLAQVFQEALSAADSSRKVVPIIDMSRYVDPQVSRELIGAGAQFRGSREGTLTGLAAESPKGVIVLDEVDRACETAHNILLQVLDMGEARDEHTGQMVSFRDNIIICTANAGRDLYMSDRAMGLFRDVGQIPRSVLVDAVQKGMPPSARAMLDRIRHIVLFAQQSYGSLSKICRAQIDRIVGAWESIGVRFPNLDAREVSNLLLLGAGGDVSGRSISGLLQDYLVSPIQQYLFQNPEQAESIRNVCIRVGELPAESTPEPQPVVLIVEDDKTIADDICGIIADLCRPKTAINLVEAKEQLRIHGNAISVVLLDLHLAGPIPSDFEPITDRGMSPDLVGSIQFLAHLRQKFPDIGVYIRSGVLTTPHEPLYYSCVDAGGAAGIIPKDDLGDQAARDRLARRVADILDDIRWERRARQRARSGKRLACHIQPVAREETLTIWFDGLRWETTPLVEACEWFNVVTPSVSFSDLVGVDTIRDRLVEAVEYLKAPWTFQQIGATVPQGFLLHGPPGTGKTSVARALAAEADVPFIAVSGSIFAKQFIGEGPELVHRLFSVARRYAPVVLFIDELDSLGTRQTAVGQGMHQEGHRIINTLLECMDGFEPGDGVLVLGATNNPDGVDPALKRPGRFTRHLLVDVPTDPGQRRKLIEMTLTRVDVADRENVLDKMARWTAYMSPAQIRLAINEGLLFAHRANAETPTLEHFLEGRNMVLYGEKASQKWPPESERRLAIHEAGHGLVCLLHGKPIVQITIVGRGDAIGFIDHERDESSLGESVSDLDKRIDICLAGLAAEKMIGEPSTGASSDLQQASEIAAQLVYRFGMDEEYGLAVPENASRQALVTNPALWQRVQDRVKRRMQKVTALLAEHREELTRLQQALIEKRTLFYEEAMELVNERPRSE